MDRLLSSDAYLNLRFRLGLEILFGHVYNKFFTSPSIKIRDKKARLVLKIITSTNLVTLLWSNLPTQI